MMFKFIKEKIQNTYNRKVSATGLAIFRILWFSNFFMEIGQMRFFNELIFDPVPFIEKSDVNFGFGLWLWQIVILALIIGYKTRTMLVVNYFLTIIFLGTISTFEYHMFYVYQGVNFLLLFAPISKSFSLDKLITRIKTGRVMDKEEDNKVSILYHEIILYVAIGLVYFDSVFFKIDSIAWQQGYGMWIFASLPQLNYTGSELGLNNEFIAVFLGYLTLIFEFLFVFLFWFKPFRIPFFLIGVGLHIGIYIFFPIPYFAVGMLILYLLMLPPDWFDKIHNSIKSKKHKSVLKYNHEDFSSSKKAAFIKSWDIFGRIDFQHDSSINNGEIEFISGQNSSTERAFSKAMKKTIVLYPISWISKIKATISISKRINDLFYSKRFEKKEVNHLLNVKVFYYLFIAITLLQINCTAHSGVIRNYVENSGILENKVIGKAYSISRVIKYSAKKYTGITGHSVFLDGHIQGYNHIIAIAYYNQESNEEIWLPIITKTGQPGAYLKGPTWAKWSFRVNNPNINMKNLKRGIKNFSSFWLHKNNLDTKNSREIRVYVATVTLPNHWEPNYLSNGIKSIKWQLVGTGYWLNDTFTIDLPNIEKEIEVN